MLNIFRPLFSWNSNQAIAGLNAQRMVMDAAIFNDGADFEDKMIRGGQGRDPFAGPDLFRMTYKDSKDYKIAHGIYNFRFDYLMDAEGTVITSIGDNYGNSEIVSSNVTLFAEYFGTKEDYDNNTGTLQGIYYNGKDGHRKYISGKIFEQNKENNSFVKNNIGVINLVADVFLYGANYDEINSLIQQGKFSMVYNGQSKVYELSFYGNQYVDKFLVSNSKSTFQNYSQLLKGVKVAGVTLSIAGGIMSIYDYKSGKISSEKAALNMVMTGVGFVPGFGWIVSGAYAIGDATGANDCFFRMLNDLSRDPNWKLSNRNNSMFYGIGTLGW